MKKTNAAGDAMSSRVIEEITFQASILALHAAIASAGREPKNPLEEFCAGPYFDGRLQSPVDAHTAQPKALSPSTWLIREVFE